MRTALEGSRGFTLGGGRLSLRPSVEVGLRLDGGDTETGAGMDIGGGLAFTDKVTGLSLDVRVRTLVVHQAAAFTERGMRKRRRGGTDARAVLQREPAADLGRRHRRPARQPPEPRPDLAPDHILMP